MPYACPCVWGSDCKKLEAMQAGGDDSRHDSRHAEDSNAITEKYNPNSWKNVALRQKIEQYFHIPDEIISNTIVCCIRKHHFHPLLLERLDAPDEHKKKRYLSTALPAKAASNCGISDQINQHPNKPDSETDLSLTEWLGSKDTTKYLAVQVYGKDNYSHLLIDQYLVYCFCQVHNQKNHRNATKSDKRHYESADGN